MPRRRVVVTEAVNGTPGLAWNSDQPCEVETPPTSPSRQSSSSGKGPSLRRSLSRTFSTLFRSPSTASRSTKHHSPMLTNGNGSPPTPPSQPASPQTPLRDSPSPDRQEGPATLPRLYQKRPQQVTPSGPTIVKKPSRRDNSKSASCTRISDLTGDKLETSRSHTDIAETSDSTGPQRRWNSTLNTARNGENGRVRISSTFIRKSMEKNIDIPVSPSTDDMSVFDEMDSSAEHPRHSWTKHKPRPRSVKRSTSRVERKEAYSSSDGSKYKPKPLAYSVEEEEDETVRSRPSSMSGSTTTLTRLQRKAPVAMMTDL